MDLPHPDFFLLHLFEKGNESIHGPGCNLVVGLGEYVAEVSYSGNLEVCRKDGIIAILSGHLYHDLLCSSLPGLYLKYAEKTGEYLSGSFNIIILDEPEKRVIVITDRLASLPAFQYQYSGGWMVSSSCTHLATILPDNPALDLAGVAWYLTNGAVHNNHTLFTSISRLERGTIYTTDKNRITSYEYAKYDYFNTDSDRSINIWIDDINDVISGAVADCAKNKDPLYFSLSGGNDSSSILGALKYRHMHPDVKTFSYGIREDNELSDAFRGVRLAELTDYEYTFIKSYQGDFIRMIELNAAWGDGISNICDETDVWLHFAGQFQNNRPACLFGDTAFAGRVDHKLEDDSDLLRNAMVRSISLLSWIGKYIGQDLFRYLKDTLDKENDLLLMKARENSPDMMHQLCYLYAYARGKGALFPWRANFCNRAFHSLNPLYHDDCFELSRTIPSSLRMNKILFKKALEKMAPDFISIKKAQKDGYVPNWKEEIRKNLPFVKERYLSESHSMPIDDLILPGIIFKIIQSEIPGSGITHSPGHIQNLITGLSKINPFGQKKAVGPAPPKMPPEKFILRYLVLRRTLELVWEKRRKGQTIEHIRGEKHILI